MTLDIVEVANELGLRKGDDKGEEKVYFDKHDNETPDLWVNPQKNRWYTYAGGQNKGGGYVDLVEHIRECGRERAKEWLRDQFPETYSNKTSDEVEKTKEAREALNYTKKASHAHLVQEAEPLAKAICDKRNFEMEDIRDAQIGLLSKNVQEELEEKFSEETLLNSGLYTQYEDDDGETNTYCHLTNRIIYPYMDSTGETLFIAGRVPFDDGETYPEPWSDWFDEDSDKYKKTRSTKFNRHILYQFRSEESDNLIITEGFTDALSVKKCGYDTVTPATTTFRNDDIEKMAKVADQYRNVFIANDGDEAGQKGAKETAQRLAKRGIDSQLVQLPDGEDFDGYTTENGYEISEFIEEAESFLDILCEDIENAENRKENLEMLFEVVREWGKTERRELFEKQINSLNRAEMMERYHEYLKEAADKRKFDFTDYCEINEDGEVGEFRPAFLGEDIMSDFDFVTLRDSSQILIYKDGWWQPKGQKFIKEECNRRLGAHFKPRYMNNTVDYIKTHPDSYTARENFKPPDKKINLENGVYDLEEGKIEPHSPAYHFTYKVPWKFNPEADCPETDSFLDDVTHGNEEKKQKVYEIVGYGLMPSNLKNKAAMFAGSGSNGKTVWIDIMKYLYGSKNTTNKTLQELEDSFDMNDLYGTLSFLDDDIPPAKLSDGASSKLKKLTGGTDMGAEIKFGDHYDFTPYCFPVFAANQIPPTPDKSDGFFRRWLIVDFPVNFSNNPNPNLELEKEAEPREDIKAKLKTREEMEGLLYKSIQALRDVFERNEFTAELETDQKRQKWKEHSTPIISFIERFVEQGVTKSQDESEREEKKESGFNMDMNQAGFDYIRRDDLQRMVGAWAKKRGAEKPRKKEITDVLEDSDLHTGITQVRREPEEVDPNKDRVRVHSGIKIQLDAQESPRYLLRLYQEKSNQSVEVVNAEEDDSKKPISNRVHDFMVANYNDGSSLVEDVLDHMIEEDVIEESERDDAKTVLDNGLNDGTYFDPKPGEIQVL